MGKAREEGRISRRDFAKGAMAGAAAAATGPGLMASASPAAADPPAAAPGDQIGGSRAGAPDVALVNGKFVDGRCVVAKALTIKDGRIFAVDQARAVGPDTTTFNLKGRTVIPGLIDSSVHFTRAGTNVGYETRWIETAFSLDALRLYTVGSAWFSKEETELGSFDVGKLGDLAVLSDDFLTVPEARIPRITSLLTLQGGRPVDASGEFASLAG